MTAARKTTQLLLMAASLLSLGACSSTTSTVAADGIPDYEGPRFNKILVIGVADNYEGRTRYERSLSSGLRAAGTTASAYYVATGGNKPVIRETLEGLAAKEGFDGVLISRVTNRDSDATVKPGQAGAKATRRDYNKPLDLFRYDYEELNEPETLNMSVNMTILTELFSMRDGNRVWAIETTVSDVETIAEVINETSSAVIKRLQTDGLIRN